MTMAATPYSVQKLLFFLGMISYISKLVIYQKILINAQAFIRLITFFWEGSGHLLEAILEIA